MEKELVYGKSPVLSVLENNKNISRICIQRSFNDQKTMNIIRNKNLKYEVVDKKVLDKLTNFANHQGIAVWIPGYTYLSLDDLLIKNEGIKNPCILMLDGIEDPHNLGAILRSVDCTNCQGVIIGKHNQVQLNATVAKVSTGAIEHVDVVQVTNLTRTLQTLKEKGYWVVGAEAHESSDFREVNYDMPVVIVVGSEGKGISSLVLKQCDFRVRIPMAGHVNSLNVSVATALLLYQVYLSRNPLKK